MLEIYINNFIFSFLLLLVQDLKDVRPEWGDPLRSWYLSPTLFARVCKQGRRGIYAGHQSPIGLSGIALMTTCYWIVKDKQKHPSALGAWVFSLYIEIDAQCNFKLQIKYTPHLEISQGAW